MPESLEMRQGISVTFKIGKIFALWSFLYVVDVPDVFLNQHKQCGMYETNKIWRIWWTSQDEFKILKEQEYLPLRQSINSYLSKPTCFSTWGTLAAFREVQPFIAQGCHTHCPCPLTPNGPLIPWPSTTCQPIYKHPRWGSPDPGALGHWHGFLAGVEV